MMLYAELNGSNATKKYGDDETEETEEIKQLRASVQSTKERILALEEESNLNRDLIQNLESEKAQLVEDKEELSKDKQILESEKQKLLAAQMELAVASECRSLTGDVLSDVEITGLKELNGELTVINQLLQEQLNEERVKSENAATLVNNISGQMEELKQANNEILANNQLLAEEKVKLEGQWETVSEQV